MYTFVTTTFFLELSKGHKSDNQILIVRRVYVQKFNSEEGNIKPCSFLPINGIAAGKQTLTPRARLITFNLDLFFLDTYYKYFLSLEL